MTTAWIIALWGVTFVGLAWMAVGFNRVFQILEELNNK